jgi:hypothetical protein
VYITPTVKLIDAKKREVNVVTALAEVRSPASSCSAFSGVDVS